MIKKVIDTDGNKKQSNIISTEDIVLRNDKTTTLDEVLSKQAKEINDLKKWTKWSIKYGGMGTGSGGGGSSSSTSFKYTLLIRNDTEVWEVTSPTNLGGSGNYTLTVNLSKTQGHSFQIYYWKGVPTSGKPTGTVFVSEGISSIDIKLGYLSDKFILSCQVRDNNTDELSEIKSYTIVPNSFLISYELKRKIDGTYISSKAEGGNNSITVSALDSGLDAKFIYTIYEDISLYFKIRYKFELDDWTTAFEETITNEGGNTISGELLKELFWNILENKDRYIGQKLEIQLICSTKNQGEIPASEEGSFEPTVIPDGYYISLTDGGSGTLYLRENQVINPETGDVLEGVNMIGKGYLPFYVNLYYTSQTERSVRIKVEKFVNGNYIYNQDSDISKFLRSNTTYSMSNTYGIRETNAGTYRITATLQTTEGVIETVKYFHIDEKSTDWSYFAYETDNGIQSGLHVFYENSDADPSPDIKTPISLYNNSYTSQPVPHTNLEAVSKQMNESVVLGLQYDSSNNDNYPFLKINMRGDGSNDIRVYQSKITQGTSTDEHYLIGSEEEDGCYFPKTENADETIRDKWHLLHININYIKRAGNDGNVDYCELCIYIDGILEGVAKTSLGNSTTTALDTDFVIKNIIINPEKKHILKLNLLDISYLPISNRGFAGNGGNYSYLYDIYAVNYYNKYRDSLGFSGAELDNPEDITKAKNFKFDELSLPYLSSAGVKGLFDEGIDVPVVILVPTETNNKSAIKDWFYPTWPEKEDETALDTKALQTSTGSLIYIPENTILGQEDSVTSYTVKDGNNPQSFSFELQGSSTKSYGVKNVEVSIVNNESGIKKVFTPKFNKNDKKHSLLPEASFTLKADMVDSSACNNNSIGEFINNNIKDLDRGNKAVGGFEDYIKNCLIGFPVLVFIHPDNTDTPNDKYYFVGIYNFNLGRKSNFNLGYYKESAYNNITDLLNDTESTTGVRIFKINEDDLVFNENLCVAEVSNNSPYWDFSQYHNSVLFDDEKEPRDADKSMFSDFVPKRTETLESTLSNAIRAIARAGGYIFESLGKTLIPIRESSSKYGNPSPYMAKKTFTYGYDEHGDEIKKSFPINGVPDYKVQYKRTLDSYEPISVEQKAENIKELTDCIGIYTVGGEEEATENTPYLDLRSTVEYYVICQCFGMVDSVQKNLQLKSWGGKTIFPAFYDMDTALGINNQGKAVDYFAFSDFWEVDNQLSSGNIYDAREANIYPDFWDTNKGSGFDYPSSYLFAIAKYSTMDILGNQLGMYLPKTEDDLSISPVNIYSKYRRTSSGTGIDNSGDLETADKFIQRYFIDRLKGIPTTLKNLNIRSKYAKVAYWLIDGYNGQTTSYINSAGAPINLSELTDIEKFQGSGKFKKRDWLNSRLHLLDAYFNLNKSIDYSVYTASIDDINKTVVWTPKKKGDYDYCYPTRENNDSYIDATISEQIFPESQSQGTLNITNLLVRAPRLTPIIFYASGRVQSYLVGDEAEENYYRLNLNTAGSNVWRLLGSRELRYINNLGLFRLNNSSIISDNLREINYVKDSSGGSINITSINLSTPNVEKINIVGSNNTKFAGELVLDQNYPFNRLNEINLSNTYLKLDTNTKTFSLTSINLENINSSQISLRNVKIEKDCTVRLDGATIDVLTIPEWKKNIILTENDSLSSSYVDYYKKVKIKKLNLIESENFNTGEITVQIINMKDLEEITISKNVKKLRLENCGNLNTISINTYSDENLTAIETLEIIDCSYNSEQEKLKIGTKEGVINLSSLGRTGKITLNMKNTRYFEEIIIGNNTVNLPSSALSGCKELKYLKNDTNGKFYLNGTSTFKNSENFTLTSGDEETPEYPRILALKEDGTVNTNISETFSLAQSIESSGGNKNIELSAVCNFLANNEYFESTQIASEITNIDNLFLRQVGIGKNWDWTSATTLGRELAKYKKIQNCTHSFARCGISHWNKNLFSFGSLSTEIYIDGTFYYSQSSGAKVTTNFLDSIKSKIVKYIDSGPNTNEVQYYVVYNTSNLNTPPSEFLLSSILGGLTNCTELTGLCFPTGSGAQTVNLQGCFVGSNKIQSISRFLLYGKWKNLCWTAADEEIGSCFKGLTYLNDFHTSFGYENNPEEINLFELFTGPQWKSINLNSDSDYSSFTQTFRGKKTIKNSDFETLWNDYLSNNSNSKLTTLNSIFWNCNITNCGSASNKIILPISGPSRITSLRNLFRNTKAFKDNGDQIPLYFKEQSIVDTSIIGEPNAIRFTGFFSNLPNVVNCIYTFSETWLEKTPPFNFFKKREEKKLPGWQKRVISVNTEGNDPEKTYIYTVTENGSSPEYTTIEEIKKTATELKNEQCWSKKKPDFESVPKYYYWEAELSENTITNKKNTKYVESFSVIVKERTYTKKLSNISGIFKDCTYRDPTFYFPGEEDGIARDVFINALESYIVEAENRNNRFTTYYSTENCTSEGTFGDSVEINDLKVNKTEGLEQNVDRVMDISERRVIHVADDISDQFVNYTIFGSHNDHYPIISPDFFFGTTDGGTISSAFSNSNESYSASPNESNRGYILQGFLPEHLLSTKNSTALIDNFIQNLNVFPVMSENNKDSFVFIPRNFSNNGRTNFDSALNFNIRVPKDGVVYYLVYKDSLVSRSNQSGFSFRKGLPQFAKKGSRGSGVSGIINNWTSGTDDPADVVGIRNYDFDYRVIYERDSFNSIFKGTDYGNFLSSHMAYILSDEEMWDSNITMKSLLESIKTSGTKFIYESLIRRTDSSIRGINSHFKLPDTKAGFGSEEFSKFCGSGGSSVGRISETTVTTGIEYWINQGVTKVTPRQIT